MKTASVRDLRQHFPDVLHWINDGEDVLITLRRKVIARIIPEKKTQRKKVACPDFKAIRKEIFGDRPPMTYNPVEEDRSGRW